jgi:hypothetical protein
MSNKCSIYFTGRAGLLFTDENGERYRIDTEMLASKKYDMVIYQKDIEPIDRDLKLNDKDKEIIISKILGLTEGIKWMVQR